MGEIKKCISAFAKLERCPCGIVPDNLCIANGSSSKWAYVSGGCCGQWEIEFRTNYKKIDSDDCMALAIIAWNETIRGEWFDG